MCVLQTFQKSCTEMFQLRKSKKNMAENVNNEPSLFFYLYGTNTLPALDGAFSNDKKTKQRHSGLLQVYQKAWQTRLVCVCVCVACASEQVWVKQAPIFNWSSSCMTDIVSMETSRRRMCLAVHVLLCMLLHSVCVTTDGVYQLVSVRVSVSYN